MGKEEAIKYPIGQQDFKRLRESGCIYVDKTQYIETIINDGGGFFFLGRPRRFGKSLFLSALRYFFEGKRELFRGLYIDSIDWDWERHPVLTLDLTPRRYESVDLLKNVINNHLLKWEEEYGITPKIDDISARFGNVIEAAHLKTGRQVVVLVDEYDKPLINNIHNPDMFYACRNQLSSIYAHFKSQSEHLRLVFLTGVSRFSKLNLFSDLNNISNISLSDDYAAICGVTEQEMLDNFQSGIEELAQKRNVSYGEMVTMLKRKYDGYHFAKECPDIYNPFSLLSAIRYRDLTNYWIETGTPTLLVDQLKKFDVDISLLLDSEASATELSGLNLEMPNLQALFYQTGYLTIKSFDWENEVYRLGIPNDEVREGLMSYLLPVYVNISEGTAFFINNFLRELREGNVDGFMKRMQTMFAKTSYEMHLENERQVQNAILILMTLFGKRVEAERRTSDGRIDIFISTKRFYYIIELKFNGTAQEAMNQINRKEYALPFELDGKEIIKIGANFSDEKRTITDWIKE